MSDHKEACKNCHYGFGIGAFRVECRRRAPVFVEVRVEHPDGRKVVSAFPVMHEREWCGEWRERSGQRGQDHHA